MIGIQMGTPLRAMFPPPRYMNYIWRDNPKMIILNDKYKEHA